jgi:hypothetical protein
LIGVKIILIAIFKRLFLGTPFSVKELWYIEIENRAQKSCILFLFDF